MRIEKIFIIVPLISFPIMAYSNTFSLGVQSELQTQAYHAKHTHYYTIPYIGYDNNIWYVDGTEAGLYLLKDSHNEFKLKAYYSFQDAYNPADGHSDAMKMLNKRRATAMTGLSYQRTTSWGAIFTQVVGDALNNSKGITATVAYLTKYSIQSTDLYGEAGSDWANVQQTRYYYGVSQEEADRSKLNAYQPHQSLTPFIMLAIDHKFTPSWEGYVETRYNFLSSTVRNSPIVDRNSTYNVVVGINYNF